MKSFLRNLMLLFVILATVECVPERKTGVDALLQKLRSAYSRSINKEYDDLALELHNFIRMEHNTPPLKANAELASAAQATAELLVNSEDFEGANHHGALSDPVQISYSQNVYNISDEWLSTRKGIAILYSVAAWYDGVNEYNSTVPFASPFTRLVWKSSTDFGVGIARNGNNTAIVANYYPASPDVSTPENFKLFQENVLPEKLPEDLEAVKITA